MVSHTGLPVPEFAKSSVLNRNGSVASLGEPSEGNVYTEVDDGGTGFKYDLYCDYPRNSTPMGVWEHLKTQDLQLEMAPTA